MTEMKLTKEIPFKNHSCSESGLTVLELVVALLLTGVVTTAALGQLSKFKGSIDRFNARMYLVQDLRRAQAQTLAEGCRGIFRILNSGRKYSFGCDYLPYDAAATPSPDSFTITRDMPAYISIAATKNVIFNSRGECVDKDGIIDSVTITLTDSSATARIFATGTLMATGLFALY